MSNDFEDRDYEVGYGKPPKHTQFKPGQSGNPKGRPKDSRNVKMILQDVAMEEITLTENGVPRKMSKKEALIRSLYIRALGGDNQAARLLFKIDTQYQRAFHI